MARMRPVQAEQKYPAPAVLLPLAPSGLRERVERQRQALGEWPRPGPRVRPTREHQERREHQEDQEPPAQLGRSV